MKLCFFSFSTFSCPPVNPLSVTLRLSEFYLGIVVESSGTHLKIKVSAVMTSRMPNSNSARHGFGALACTVMSNYVL